MKKLKLRTCLLVSGLTLGICCLGAAPYGFAAGKTDETASVDAFDEQADVDSWEDDEWEHDEEFDEEHEIELYLAEQDVLTRSVELAVDVANDEVKTAVVTATLLLEHVDLNNAIDSLSKAVEQTNSKVVKRALQLKLAEAHLENDDPSSAIAIATQLMAGD